MTTTHDDATAWRDLTDQLTAGQITTLEGIEARGEYPADELTGILLTGAREYAAHGLQQHQPKVRGRKLLRQERRALHRVGLLLRPSEPGLRERNVP